MKDRNRADKSAFVDFLLLFIPARDTSSEDLVVSRIRSSVRGWRDTTFCVIFSHRLHVITKVGGELAQDVVRWEVATIWVLGRIDPVIAVTTRVDVAVSVTVL